MNQAVLCGYYGMGNSGDEALLATLLQLLPTAISPLVLSGNPAETTRLHQVAAIDRQDVLGVWRALGQSHYFIWGGGSLMQDATSWRNPFYYGSLMLLAKGLGLTTIAWAQGIGPLHRPLSQWITHQSLRQTDRISVRDHRSAKLLEQWHLPCVVAPDPVWALASAPTDGREAPSTPLVAVVLRPHPHLTQAKLNILQSALISFQKVTDVHYLLLPFHPHQDLEIARMLHRAIPQSTLLTLENPRSLKSIFEGVTMTIGMRLHGLIMAAAAGSRCWAISYDPKVTQLMEDLALPGWEVQDIPSDGAQIVQAWLQLWHQGQPIPSEQLQSLRNHALQHQKLLST